MDVPFFLSLATATRTPKAFELLPLGFTPVPPAVPQAHRLLSCNSVSLSPKAIPERLEDVPDCYSGSGPFRRDSNAGAPITIHRTGQMRPGRSGAPS